METFGQGNVPGFQSNIESEEKELRAAVEGGNNPITQAKVVVDSTVADSGNTPTTTIRGGNLMAIAESDGNAYLLDPDADGNGLEKVVGVLDKHLNMLQNGSAADRFWKLLTGGVIKESELLGEDAHALARLMRMGMRIIGSDGFPLAANTALVHHDAQEYVNGAVTVGVADNGKLFVASGGDTNFTLPTIAHGLAYEFVMASDHELVITGSNNIIASNDAAASTLTWTTAGEQIGTYVRLRAVYQAASTLKWLPEILNGQGHTIGIA